MYDDVVLYANSPDASKIYPGFDGDHVVRFEPPFLSSSDPWIFVYFQPQTVARTVHEVIVETVACQNSPRRGIHIPAGGSSLYRRDCG